MGSTQVDTLVMPYSSTAINMDSHASRLRDRLVLDAGSPVNQNGSFEFDREIKSGYVQKRTQKTKKWKTVYLVLRPNALSIYKSDKESKLRHKVYLSDLTAVAFLKDPKQKRKNVFGLFSPSRNFHFQAPSAEEANAWVDLIRKDARIDEEEEEMLFGSPLAQGGAPNMLKGLGDAGNGVKRPVRYERMLSSSPEPLEPPVPRFMSANGQKPLQAMDSSGASGNELASHSDFSDNDVQRIRGASIEHLKVQRPSLGQRNASQVSGIHVADDPDRVIWQGWLWFLRSKGGVRQWKDSWAVLRPRNLILYRDESEYIAQFILPLSAIVNVVDIDPVSKTKTHCMQVITEEKSYRLCAHGEESLVQCLGAFKSLLAKRRELEARAAAGSS